MKSHKAFIFESYSLDRETGILSLRYALDEEVFTETVTFPAPIPTLASDENEALDRALFLLHIVGGISYYKATCPREMIVKSGNLTQQQADFFNELYTKGLGEFWYKNQIDFRGRVNFHFNSSVAPTALDLQRATRVLLPVGGGKDSLVSAELFKKHSVDFTAISVHDHAPIRECIEIMGVPRIIIGRQLDSKLIAWNASWEVYNGHVPVTAYNACVLFVASILYGYSHVAFSLERSSNYGQLEYLGMDINHQFSKGQAFETALWDYTRNFITPSVRVFSLLRPWYELRIAEEFARLQGFEHGQKIRSVERDYTWVMTSCNRAYRIHRERPTGRWCGECEKCAFVWLILAPFFPRAEMERIFSKNLFTDTELLPTYRELLWLTGHKPFECVGTPDESALAFDMIRERGEYTGTAAMQMFESEFLISRPFHRAVTEREVMSTVIEEDFPTEFRGVLSCEFWDLRSGGQGWSHAQFGIQLSALRSQLSALAKQRVLILGMGREGCATLRFLLNSGEQMNIAVMDERPLDQLSDEVIRSVELWMVKYIPYGSSLAFDVCFRTPWISLLKPFLQQLVTVSIEMTSATNLFFEHTSVPIIAVTGSKGKSTTSSLIAAMLREAGKSVELIGNIGTPALDHLRTEDSAHRDYYVFEMSSYQLETFHSKPHIAVWTSFFPDHLDHHGNIDAYFDAKWNIVRNLRAEDVFIYKSGTARIEERLDTLVCQKKPFADGVFSRVEKDGVYIGNERMIAEEDIPLLWEHNRENILAVAAVASVLNIPFDALRRAVKNFQSLPHRLQTVGTFQDITFVDDAISTTPESTIAAIRSMRAPIGSIVLGGLDRGYDFTALAEEVLSANIGVVVLLPDSWEKIADTIRKKAVEIGTSAPVFFPAGDMKTCVQFLFEHTPHGTIALLSCASPSYSIFKNFEDKGNQFQMAIRHFNS